MGKIADALRGGKVVVQPTHIKNPRFFKKDPPIAQKKK